MTPAAPSAQATQPAGVSVLAKGFRVFFALAGLHAAVFIPAWILILTGHLALAPGYIGVSWHAHEMLYGFALAVIAGFLLTAVGNWTGRETVIGGRLGALALLWVAGRVAPFLLPLPLAAAIDFAFIPALMLALALPLIATRNTRNYQFLIVLGALALNNLALQLCALGVLHGWERRGHLVAVDVVAVLIAVVSARVVPMFTRNTTESAVQKHPKLEGGAIAGLVALTACDALSAPSSILTPVAIVTAALLFARSWGWGALRSVRYPMLWVLHVGLAWLTISVILRAVPGVAANVSLHALTVGCVAMLCLGMMARVSLGHTGRKIVTSKAFTAAFACLLLTAVVRVLGPLLLSADDYLVVLDVSAATWCLAFVLFLYGALPALVSPRVDGKPG